MDAYNLYIAAGVLLLITLQQAGLRSMMATLRIYLLGPFEVFLGDRPLETPLWRSRQTRLLLRVLATHVGHVVSTDQLLEYLWPDEDPATARKRLYVRLSELRRALDPGDPAAYILTTEAGYTFNPEADCRIDMRAFEAQVQQGRRLQEQGRLEAAICAYEAARALYRGDLLAEDLYQDWAFAPRERLRECFLTMSVELAECYAQQGRYRRAMACCRRVLQADPCREAVYVRLMLYHYYAGERPQALRAYEQCTQVLRDELGVEPLPATMAMFEAIRAGTLWASQDAPRYPPPAYEGRLFAVPYSLGHTPFVGREREYAWLVERWRDPRTRVLLVEGEMGVGKSRLIDEFLGYVATTGGTVLRARPGSGEVLPYAPIVAALRTAPDLWEGPISPSPALLPLFPELRQRDPDLPAWPELPARQERERLLRAIEMLVQDRFSPDTLLYLDDAHRIDPASLELLVRLAEHLTVVLAGRSGEMPTEHRLRRALHPLRREGRLDDLCLGRLSPEAVDELVRHLAGADLPTLTQRLVAQTGGNPLFIVAALQHSFEQGVLLVDAQGYWALAGEMPAALPPTVRQAIEARLRRLQREPRRLFDLAVVAGGEFNFSLLQQASGMAEEPLLDTLDLLLEAGLLVEPRAGGRAEFALPHGYYGEVTYDTLPRPRRRQLHRRVAEALERTATDLDLAAPDLAGHFERAGQAAAAFTWWVRAGEAAHARHAHGEALAFYRRAVALEVGEPAAVWERMGRIAHHLARYAEGVRHQRRALARWQALGDVEGQIRAHYALAEGHRELSQYHEAARQARAGLALVTTPPDYPRLAAWGEIVLSNALRSGQLAPAETVRRHLERALALARPAQAWDLVAEACFWLGVVTVNSGDAAGALSYDREALERFRHSGQLGWEAIALNNLAYHALLAGQAGPGLAWAEEGLSLARRIGSRNVEGWLLSTLGEIQTHLDNMPAARATLEEGLSLVTRWGPPRLRPGFLADLARVDMAGGNWAAALERLEEAWERATETAPQFLPRLSVYLAEAYLGREELVRAEEHARQAQETAQEKGQRGVEGQAWRVWGQVHAALDRPARAEAAFAHSLELLAEVDDALERARTLHAWGRWLAQQGDERAEDCLGQARRAFEACGAVLDLRLTGSA